VSERDIVEPADGLPRPGAVLRDLTGEIVVLVLETNGTHGHLLCDGVRMIAARPLPCGDPRNSSVTGSTLLSGRRYADRMRRIEVRCLRGGHARLSFVGFPLTAALTAVEQCPRNRTDNPAEVSLYERRGDRG
jgi:hypothetical protein